MYFMRRVILLLFVFLYYVDHGEAGVTCRQTLSVIPLVTGNEVIKFWKVMVKGQDRWGRYALY